MKKLFTLIAAALIGTSAFADATFHSPGAKLAGAPFECLWMSDAMTKATDGKYYIGAEYPWIQYHYSQDVTEFGNAVARFGGYVSINPIWTNPECVYVSRDAVANMGTPKIEVGFPGTKSAAGFLTALTPKTITFNVEKATRVDFLLTGSASKNCYNKKDTTRNDCYVLVKKADGTLVESIYVEDMTNRSDRTDPTNARYPHSKLVTVKDLDVASQYQISIVPSGKSAQVQVQSQNELEETVKEWKLLSDVLGQNDELSKDIELTDANCITNYAGSGVTVVAVHIFSNDLTVDGKKPMNEVSTTDFYSPVGNKIDGTGFAYVQFNDALTVNGGTLTTFDASGNASHAAKTNVADANPWMFYNYTGSILDNGKCEVSLSNEWSTYSSINPITGAEEIVDLAYDGVTGGGRHVGFPKAELGYTPGETYLAELNPKSVILNVKEAKKVEVLLTGAGSSNNYADVVVKKMDGTVVSTQTVGPMYGKSQQGKTGTGSNKNANSMWATVDNLDAATTYQIVVAPSVSKSSVIVKKLDELEQEYTDTIVMAQFLGEGADFSKDIPLTDAQKVANVAGCGTVAVLGIRVYEGEINLNDVIAAACATEDNEVTIGLDGKRTYELKGKVQAGNANQGVTILGNGAKIVTDATGQITTKNYLVIDNVDIDATASTVAPIAMAPKADITKADTATIMSWYTAYDEEEAMAYNEAHAQEIAQGTMDPIHTGDIKQASDWVAKYTGANLKVFEAQLLSLTNSKVKTAWSLISGNDAPWALHKLYLENNIIEFTYNDKKDKKENISWYGGANSIQDITFVNNTFFCDSVSNNAYFLRYSNGSNAQPQKVWGKDGTASWTMTSNTFVNIASNGQFANNYSNKNNVTNDFKKNIFANTRYLQKIGSSIVPNFTNVDNVICGGTNAVNSDDKSKYATEESAEVLGVYYNSAEDYSFVPGATSIALRDQMGDPRWLENAPEYVNAVDSLSKLYTEGWDLFDTMQQPTSTEYATLVAELSVAKSILNPETGDVDAQAAYKEIAPLAAAIEAYKKLINPATGIANVAVEKAVNDGRVYNLAGQRVNANTKGMVIKNGRKYIVK